MDCIGSLSPTVTALMRWTWRSLPLVVVFVGAEEFFGVPVGVGSGLAAVEMRRRDPVGVASGGGAGGPAIFGESIVGTARQGQVVDVGAAGDRPAPDMVDLAVVGGGIAPWFRAPTIL